MKSSTITFCMLFILIFALTELHAQETIPSTGGDFSGYGGSVSYSVGQVFFQTQSGSKGASSEGVQHPYIVSKARILTGTEDVHLSVLAYPNPVTRILYLELTDYHSGNLAYLITDMQGKLMKHIRITSPKTTILMSHLPPAPYIVHLTKDNDLVNTFKIIKN